jgi:hypothetical protein
MTTRIRKPSVDSLMTTDDRRLGCNTGAEDEMVDAASLTDLTAELTSALHGAYWSFMLQGELEDAFDSALLRAALAEMLTPLGRSVESAA